MTSTKRRRSTALWLGIAVALVAAATFIPTTSTSVGAFLYQVVNRDPEMGRAIPASDFLVIGHRGAAGHAVENTIASMDEAMRRGANAVEIDLCMTRDSIIVLWHDWDPDDPIATARQEGTEIDVLFKPVVPDDDHPMHRMAHELSLAELRGNYGYSHIDSTRRVAASIPTLEEFLAWSKGRPDLRVVYFDVKVPDTLARIAPAMIARIEQALVTAAPSHDVVYLAAQESVFKAIESMLPKGNISFDREPPPGLILDPCEYGSATHALSLGNRNASTIIPVTSTFAPWTTARRILECDVGRAAGRVQVITGTLNDPERLAVLVGLGLHGVITDYPERLRGVVDSIAVHSAASRRAK